MYDLVVYGATGFTGALVAEYLQSSYGSEGALNWAIAGRSESKLAALRSRIRDAKGELSSGTIASGIATFDTAAKSPAYRARLEQNAVIRFIPDAEIRSGLRPARNDG